MERWSLVGLVIYLAFDLAIAYGGWWLVKKMDVRRTGKPYWQAWVGAIIGVDFIAGGVISFIVMALELFSRF